MFDITIYSSDAVFSRMLALEFAEAGLTCGSGEARVAVCDADSCDETEIRRLRQSGLVVTFGYGDADYVRPFETTALVDKLREITESIKAPSSDLNETERLSFIDGSHVALGSRVILLTPREYTLLRCLYNGGGEPVSREALSAAVWGRESDETNVVEVYIRYLRDKLEKDGRRIIVTVRGKGYLLKAIPHN